MSKPEGACTTPATLLKGCLAAAHGGFDLRSLKSLGFRAFGRLFWVGMCFSQCRPQNSGRKFRGPGYGLDQVAAGLRKQKPKPTRHCWHRAVVDHQLGQGNPEAIEENPSGSQQAYVEPSRF